MPPFLHPLNELVGLFHDGQVRGEVGVVNTLSKPRRRSAATILPSTLVPMGMPKALAQSQHGWKGQSERLRVWSDRPGHAIHPWCCLSPPARRWGRQRYTGRRIRRPRRPGSGSKAEPIWVLKPRSLAPMTRNILHFWRRRRHSGGRGCTCCCRGPYGRRNRRNRMAGFSPSIDRLRRPRRSPYTASAARSCRCVRRTGSYVLWVERISSRLVFRKRSARLGSWSGSPCPRSPDKRRRQPGFSRL